MRTGNLPANMKKNRVLQIIPCEWSMCLLVWLHAVMKAMMKAVV